MEARGYVAEAALWVKAWRHQGQLQALIESRALVVSTELLFKVLQGYANCSSLLLQFGQFGQFAITIRRPDLFYFTDFEFGSDVMYALKCC